MEKSASKEIVKIKRIVRFEDFYRIAVNCLKTTGINLMPDEDWSVDHQEIINNFFYYYNKFWFLNGCLLPTSFIICMFLNLDDSKTSTKILTSIFTGLFNYYKAFLMHGNQDKMKDIMRKLKGSFPANVDEQENYGVGKIIKALLRMKKVYVFLYAALILASFIPLITAFIRYGQRNNIVEFWLPFELDTNGKFITYMLWMMWISISFCMCGVGSDFMFFSTLTLLSMEFNYLKKEFKRKLDERLEFKELIMRYDKLIGICNDLHAIFDDYLFFYISQSSIIVSLMCFQLAVTDDFARFVPYLIVTLNQVWLLCYFGQKLHDSSSSIFEGISESNWYEVKDIKIRKMLVFIIQRSQKPKVLSARYVIITLSTFRGILTTAYSYYTLLNRLYSGSN